MGLILPKTPTAARRQNPRRLILYGPPKIGKTTFISQLEGNFIVDLEEGTDFLESLNYQVRNLDELSEVGLQIIEDGRPYPYVTLDTITTLEDWCEMEATRDYMNSPIGVNFNRERGQLKPEAEWDSVLTLPQGAGYFWLRKSFKAWIDRYTRTASTLIMVAHIKDKMIDRAGKEVNAKDLDLTGRIRSITAAGADAIGYMYRDKENKLRITFQCTDDVVCGSRCAHLKGRDIPADWSQIFLPEDVAL